MTVRGKTTPRVFTPPLRELTPETSHGFEVIEWARTFLGIVLFPWQQWLLIHALELLPDGRYRFKKIVVLVGRQNGKTTLMKVLVLWWMYRDSLRVPDRLSPNDFLVLGLAQDAEKAEETWEEIVAMTWPPDDPSAYDKSIPALRRYTRTPVKRNGGKSARTLWGATYKTKPPSKKSTRGKSAARVLFDELREQTNWKAWSSVSKTTNAIYNSQLWGISSAGDTTAVVLAGLKKSGEEFIDAWQTLVGTRTLTVEEFAEDPLHDMTLGLFEWSAEPGRDIREVDGLLQANPSVGYGEMLLDTILSDASTDEEGEFRTEVRCEWVTSRAETHIDVEAWDKLADASSEIPEGAEITVGIATDRDYTWISVAGYRADGVAHVELIAQRTGMLWAEAAVKSLTERFNIVAVAFQSVGDPAFDFLLPFTEAGFPVFEVKGPGIGSAAGRIKDRVRDKIVAHPEQPAVSMAVSGAVVRSLGEVRVWFPKGSATHSGPIVAISHALYALEAAPRPEVKRLSVYETRGIAGV